MHTTTTTLTRLRSLLAGLLLGAVLVGTQAAAQNEPLVAPNYRNADLRQIIEAVGEVTGRTIIVDPRVQAQVTMLSATPMTPDAFYQTFLSILQVHGFVAMESNGVVRIVPNANARQFADTDRGQGDEMITRVLALDNVQAEQLVAVLRPLVPQYGHLVGHPRSNVLIISDHAANVQRMERIVERIDRAADSGVEVIPLQYARATNVAELLTQMAGPDGDGRAPMLSADPRTNSVLLGGPEAGRLRMRALLAHLDSPVDDEGDTRVRYLAYADAEDLAERLQQRFVNENGASSSEIPVSIWADRQTNALVVTAPQAEMRSIMSVVDRLDIRRAQILVEAIIVEVSSDRSADLGVTWAMDGSRDGNAVGFTNFPLVPGVVQLGAPILGGQIPSPGSFPEGIGIGVGRISDRGTSFAGLLAALQADSRANIIATPTLLTMDNEEAEIKVGQRVPFLTGSFVGVGDGAGQPTNPFQTIQREDVGTLLQITPQINRDGTVMMRIQQEISSITSAPAGAVDLVTNNREINTSVLVEDGGIVVLGGLIDETLREREQRVPVLGSLPLLGNLFRARHTAVEKTNLMVFIRPRILLDDAQASLTTEEKYDFMRALQLERAERPVQLMRDEAQPVLPMIDLSRRDDADEDDTDENDDQP